MSALPPAIRRCRRASSRAPTATPSASRRCGAASNAASRIALAATCAGVRRAGAGAMPRGVDVRVHACRARAAIERACADACAAMADRAMQRCADLRRCAEHCGRMAARAAAIVARPDSGADA